MSCRRTIIGAAVLLVALTSLVACSQDDGGGQRAYNLPPVPAPVNASLVVASTGDDAGYCG